MASSGIHETVTVDHSDWQNNEYFFFGGKEVCPDSGFIFPPFTRNETRLYQALLAAHIPALTATRPGGHGGPL